MFNKMLKSAASAPTFECTHLGFCSCGMLKTLTKGVLLCCLRQYIYNISYNKYKSVSGGGRQHKAASGVVGA